MESIGYYIFTVVNFFPLHFRRMNIEEEEEENVSVVEGKAKREVKSEKRTVETNGIKCPKQRANNDICYCDRAPGSSQSVATKPHLKASYCVETDSNKAAAADAAINKSSGKTTRDSLRGNKLSPVAKDFGGGNKTPKSYLEKSIAFKSDDIFTISRDSFPKQRGAEGRLEKSIFSCVSSRNKMRPSTVIIEELPSDEVSEIPRKTVEKSEAKKKTSLIEEKMCVNKNKELISLGKESRAKTNLTPNKIQIVNECEKPRKSTDSSETRMEIKKNTKPKEEKDTLMKGSNFDKNKKSSLENESKIKTSVPNKITSEYQKDNEKLEMEFQV